jgi:hypothetical protein
MDTLKDLRDYLNTLSDIQLSQDIIFWAATLDHKVNLQTLVGLYTAKEIGLQESIDEEGGKESVKDTQLVFLLDWYSIGFSTYIANGFKKRDKVSYNGKKGVVIDFVNKFPLVMFQDNTSNVIEDIQNLIKGEEE